jgi:hypothetical protein
MPHPFDEFLTPPNDKVIDKLWVGLSEDANGLNGICAALLPGIGGCPMVTASAKVLKIFREQAGWIEQRTGQRVKFYEFIRGGELEDES